LSAGRDAAWRASARSRNKDGWAAFGNFDPRHLFAVGRDGSLLKSFRTEKGGDHAVHRRSGSFRVGARCSLRENERCCPHQERESDRNYGSSRFVHLEILRRGLVPQYTGRECG
jgi:hypothetical protein